MTLTAARVGVMPGECKSGIKKQMHRRKFSITSTDCRKAAEIALRPGFSDPVLRDWLAIELNMDRLE